MRSAQLCRAHWVKMSKLILTDLDFDESSRPINVPAPLDPLDGANKAYVDSVAGGGLESYAVNDFDDGDPLYVGKAKSDGTWLVQRYATATDTLRYANVSNNAGYATYASAWAARTSLAYGTFQELTGV